MLQNKDTHAYELAEDRWSAGVDRLFYSIIMLVLMVTGALLPVALTRTAVAQVSSMAYGEKITGVHDLTTLVGALLAIGMGMVVGRAIAHLWRWITNPVDA